jgi:hypothetical protein
MHEINYLVCNKENGILLNSYLIDTESIAKELLPRHLVIGEAT